MTHENLMRVAKAYAEGLSEGLSDNTTELDRKNGELIWKQDAIDACLDGCCACVNDCVDEIEKLPSAESKILFDFKNTLFGIGEICVDVSKCNITAEEGINKIRDKYLDVMYRKVVQNE